MKHKGIFLILFLLLGIATTEAAEKISVADKSVGSESWVKSTFVKSRKLPFSFKLDGKSSEDFIGTWSRRLRSVVATEPNTRRYALEMLSPDKKLQLTCDIIAYSDFPAAEWTLHFTNQGADNSRQISDVNAADITFSNPGRKNDWVLYTAKGASDADTDFHLQMYEPGDSAVRFQPRAGRSSSDTAFPFFNLTAGGKAGVCIAIGWSGTWFADFSPAKGAEVLFQSGMSGTDLYLLPSETIRTPKVAIVQWEGADRMAGNNTLRRFMLAHHSPRAADGNMIAPPLCAGFDWGDPAPAGEYEALTELFARAVVERHRNFDIMPEVFWLDAGWYEGNNPPYSSREGKGWYSTAGSWEADSVRFPNGLRPLADDIHSLGAKFMVWFEPERVYEGTRIFREHPEWLIPGFTSKGEKMKSYLLNLGNDEALAYICSLIGDFIEKSGIDYYRQDFNMAPAASWEFADEPGRKGISEIKHITNLYRFWDYLLQRFPNLMIDNCASGGRRLDLETASRAIPLWRTDCNYGEPTCQQSHEYGLSQFLPLHGTGVYTTDKYNVRSGMSSAFLWGGEIFGRKNPIDGLQDMMREYKDVRRYFLGDFYPLSGDGSTIGKDKWIAWQFHDTSDGSGIVQAFRRDDAETDTYTVMLKEIDPSVIYEVYDFDTKTSERKKGSELAGDFVLNLADKRSSRLLRYRPVSE